MLPFLFAQHEPASELMTALVLGSVSKLVAFIILGRKHRRKFQKVGTVSNLYLFPIKSCGYFEDQEADCTSVGLKTQGFADRNWTVLDENDKSINSKKEPKLLQVRCESFGDQLRFHAPGQPPLDLPKHVHLYQTKVENLLYKEQMIKVYDCGETATKWISDYLGRRARIIFSCRDVDTRKVHERKRKWENTSRPGDEAVFAYLTPYLVTTTASLNYINERIEQPVSSLNFRPNIVIETDIPFDEDNWQEMRIGNNALFHNVEPCLRCSITTLDPDTGDRRNDQQPLELLKSFRRREPYGKSPLFGLYMANDVEGHVRVGDPVYALRASS